MGVSGWMGDGPTSSPGATKQPHPAAHIIPVLLQCGSLAGWNAELALSLLSAIRIIVEAVDALVGLGRPPPRQQHACARGEAPGRYVNHPRPAPGLQRTLAAARPIRRRPPHNAIWPPRRAWSSWFWPGRVFLRSSRILVHYKKTGLPLPEGSDSPRNSVQSTIVEVPLRSKP